MDAPFVGRIRGKGRGKGRGSREFTNSSSRPPDAMEQTEQWSCMNNAGGFEDSTSCSKVEEVKINLKREISKDIQGYLRHAVPDADVVLEQPDTMQRSTQTSSPDFSLVLLLSGTPCDEYMKEVLCNVEAVLMHHGATGIDQRRLNQGKFIRAELKGVRFNVFVGGREADRLFGRARGRGLPYAIASSSSRTSFKDADRAVGRGVAQFWEKMGLPQGSRLQDHYMDLLARARPGESKLHLRQEICKEVQELIHATLANSESILAGSSARETDLSLNSDIDLIVLLPGTPSDDEVRAAMTSLEAALLKHGAAGMDGKRPHHSAANITVQLRGVTFDIVAGGRDIDPLADRPAQSFILVHKMLAHRDIFKETQRSVKIAAVILKWWLRDALSGSTSCIVELLACFAGRRLIGSKQTGDDGERAANVFVEVTRLLVEWEDLRVTWDHPGDSWKPFHGSCKPLILDVFDPAENIAARWTPSLWQRLARLAKDALEALSM